MNSGFLFLLEPKDWVLRFCFCSSGVMGHDSGTPSVRGLGHFPVFAPTTLYLELKTSFSSDRVKSLAGPGSTCLPPGGWLTPQTDSPTLCGGLWVRSDFHGEVASSVNQVL